ncbi:MAG TPA: MFS transporter [Steroidobacteraceae bacterium]
MPPAKAASESLYSKGYRTWLLTVLLLMNVLNLADRQGMAAVAQAIKQDLKLSDGQMGIIQGLGFAIFYTLFALPIARLAERRSRVKIVSAALVMFGIMVSLCSAAQGFWQLLLFRIGVGVGDAGSVPPVASLLADHYPMERRASVISIVWLGAPIGVVFGSMLGGWMAEHVSWRAAFIAIGAPGLIVAILAVLTLREPPRGMSDLGPRPVGPPPSIAKVLGFLLAKPSVRHVLIGCALAAMGMNAIGQFFGQFLVRTFHIGFAEAGRLLSIVAAGAMASGLTLGGFGVDWAGKFDRRWYVWGPAIGLTLATPLFMLGFAQATLINAVIILVLAHVVLFVYYTPTLAIAQNSVGADMRASAAFVISLMFGLVGIGLGPTLLGFLSDRFAHNAFAMGDFATLCRNGAAPAGAASQLADACKSASAIGIKNALIAVSLLFVWAAAHYVLAAKHLRADLDTHYAPPPRDAVPSMEGAA